MQHASAILKSSHERCRFFVQWLSPPSLKGWIYRPRPQGLGLFSVPSFYSAAPWRFRLMDCRTWVPREKKEGRHFRAAYTADIFFSGLTAWLVLLRGAWDMPPSCFWRPVRPWRHRWPMRLPRQVCSPRRGHWLPPLRGAQRLGNTTDCRASSPVISAMCVKMAATRCQPLPHPLPAWFVRFCASSPPNCQA